MSNMPDVKVSIHAPARGATAGIVSYCFTGMLEPFSANWRKRADPCAIRPCLFRHARNIVPIQHNLAKFTFPLSKSNNRSLNSLHGIRNRLFPRTCQRKYVGFPFAEA